MIAALADLFAWSEDLPLAAAVVAAVGASAVAWMDRVWSEESLVVKACAMAAVVAFFLWTFAMTEAPRLTVLALWGDPVVARVVDDDVIHQYRSDMHCYSLQRGDGTPLFGSICRQEDDFAVGERLTVLVDPSGLIAPETPDEVADARIFQILGLVSFVATLAFCWITGSLLSRPGRDRLVRRRLPRPPRSRRRSKYGP
ncbi:hypothetical protein [Micromonospora chersina]